MDIGLESIPVKLEPGFTPGLGIFSYPEQAAIAEPMLQQDPRFVFYALRVMNDELWNNIDGERSVEEIADGLCFQFGFALDPELFIPLFKGLLQEELIGLQTE